MKSLVGGQAVLVRRRKLPSPAQVVDQSHFAQVVADARVQSIAQELLTPKAVVQVLSQPSVQGMPPRDPVPCSSVDVQMVQVKRRKSRKNKA